MNTVTKSIVGFMLRSVAVVLPVVAVAVWWYVSADPYKVLRRYDTYLPDPCRCPIRVGINKGLITVTNYHERLAEGHSYNAFIFGSSVSCYYDAELWASLADSTGRASAYHFDSSGETLQAMADKVEYLDRLNQDLDYALVVLDPIVMGADDNDGPATVAPPQMHRSLMERIRYHYMYFRAAVNADFFKSWIPYRLTGCALDNGRNRVFEPQPIVYDPMTNQESVPQWDSLIAVDHDKFYSVYPLAPSPDKVTESAPLLDCSRAEALRRVAGVFARRGTDYQIIIGPNRRKIALNKDDLARLRQIFAPSRIHDFSCSMAGALECDTLLYDNTHYRPSFSTRLMRCVYGR